MDQVIHSTCVMRLRTVKHHRIEHRLLSTNQIALKRVRLLSKNYVALLHRLQVAHFAYCGVYLNQVFLYILVSYHCGHRTFNSFPPCVLVFRRAAHFFLCAKLLQNTRMVFGAHKTKCWPQQRFTDDCYNQEFHYISWFSSFCFRWWVVLCFVSF